MSTVKNPFVSVVIPVREINYFLLFENLPAFLRQEFKNFEVIVLPNEHTQYDLELFKKYSWLRIIPSGKITRPAEKRDLGVKNAKGEIIAFIDDDGYPDPLWLKTAVTLFKEKKGGAICGPGVIPPNSTFWEQVFDAVLQSPLGSGKYTYRFTPQKTRFVDDYPSMNFLIEKKLFENLGGFNSDYWPGEDSKLCNDLVYKENRKIYYHPDVRIYHHRRNNVRNYLEQQGQYGFHRGVFFAEGDKNSQRLVYLIPTMFVLYLVSVFFVFVFQRGHLLSPFFDLVYIPAIIYMLCIIWLCFTSFIKSGSIMIALATAPILFLTHLLYGIMFIKGFVKKAIQKQGIYD